MARSRDGGVGWVKWLRHTRYTECKPSRKEMRRRFPVGNPRKFGLLESKAMNCFADEVRNLKLERRRIRAGFKADTRRIIAEHLEV